MGLLAGSDVDSRHSLLRNWWFLAFVVADLPVDTAIALIVAAPQLEGALARAGLPIPRATSLAIHLGEFLSTGWLFVLPPILSLPFIVAWRWQDRAVKALQIALVGELALFAVLCLVLLLPIKGFLEAS